MSRITTLVVDDVEKYRRLLCSLLESGTDCDVIGVASDGLAAVGQAEQLHPDLVLLDVGLPSINGIEVARRIRKLSPDSKILFFTQNRSKDVVQKALQMGANGYLVKSDALDLPLAVKAVLGGEQFVSSCVQPI